MDPGNRDYWMRSQAVRTRAELEAKLAPQAGPPALEAGIEAAPQPHFDPPTPQDRADARQPLPPTELKAQSGLKDFDLSGNTQRLFEEVAHAFGLDCIFDNDYQFGSPIRFHMTGVDYRTALHGLEAATGSFIVPLSDLRFLVVKDTPQKRIDASLWWRWKCICRKPPISRISAPSSPPCSRPWPSRRSPGIRRTTP